MKRLSLFPTLGLVVLATLSLCFACGRTKILITTGQFAPGDANIIITVSDPAVCAAPGGPFAHIYVTITDVQAGPDATASAEDPSLIDLTPHLAGQPAQIDLLGRPDSRCRLGTIGHGLAPPGAYKLLRVSLLQATGELPPIPGGNRCSAAGTLVANCVVFPTGAAFPLDFESGGSFDIGPEEMAGGQFVVLPTGTNELNINLDGCDSLIPMMTTGMPFKFIFSASARAGGLDQASRIGGRVIDAATGQPVAGRVIVAAEQQDAAGVDRIVIQVEPGADGAFVLCPLPPGSYDLVVAAIGAKGTAYAPTILPEVSAGSATGDIALISGGAPNNIAATVVGHVALLSGEVSGTGRVRISALAGATASGLPVTFTVPMPMSATGMLSFANSNVVPYSFSIPAANPRVGVLSPGGITYSQDTRHPPAFTVEAVGCGSTATSPSPVRVMAGGTAWVPKLTLSTCGSP